MIDWSAPVCTSHDIPRIGYVQGPCPVHGKRRVQTANRKATGPSDTVAYTIWRFNEAGQCRGDLAPSANDLVNYDPEDGIARLNLEGFETVGRKLAA